MWSIPAISGAEKFDDDVWICDSGASSRYCVSDRGMFDVREINENFRVGNGNLLIATNDWKYQVQSHSN